MSQTQTRASIGYPPPPNDDKERMRIFLQNRVNFPAQEWLRHANRHYAMSWDGLVIHASDPDFNGLLRQLDEMGIAQDQVVFGSTTLDADSVMGLTGSEIERPAE
jgi:hypothetical protein